MARARALVVRTAGTNCDRETLVALRLAGAEAESAHIARLREQPALLDAYDLVALPGGFSYGDDLGAGRILGNELRCYLADALRALIERGGLAIGICNGFQALTKAGLLPDVLSHDAPEVTLTDNTSGRFGTRWVHLSVATDRSPWLRHGDRLELPVAHAEGRFVARDEAVIDRLARAGQVALRYAAPDGGAARGFPENPSGSWGDVAGVCDPSGRILGLMPHPERHTSFHHHPAWTRRPKDASAAPDGLRLFQNAVAHLSTR